MHEGLGQPARGPAVAGDRRDQPAVAALDPGGIEPRLVGPELAKLS
jgi:hypothetical protein